MFPVILYIRIGMNIVGLKLIFARDGIEDLKPFSNKY